MTGPPYPRPVPAPGSNAIGGFQIGVSPVGTIPAFDPWATIMSQYANSPTLDALITSFNAAMDMTAFNDNFYDNMWNIQTAQGYGLDVWGRIVGVTRTLSIPGAITFFGFGEAGDLGFGQGSFYQGQQLSTNYILTDADFRHLRRRHSGGERDPAGAVPGARQVLRRRQSQHVGDVLVLLPAFGGRRRHHDEPRHVPHGGGMCYQHLDDLNGRFA